MAIGRKVKMNLSRFYDPDTGFYLSADMRQVYKIEAHLFSLQEWQAWGKDAGLALEEISEDEKMRLEGQPELPGME